MKVSGRLLSRPMIAAANADRIKRVSVCTSRVASSSARKMPATAAIDEPSAHENIGHAAGLDAVEPGELAVVDHGAHGDTEARARQQDLEPDREAQPDDDGDEARPRHQRVGDLEAAGAEEPVDVTRLLRVPDQAGEAHQGEHETDRGHDLRHQWCVGDRAHEDALDQRAHERRGDEHGEDQGNEGLDPPVHLELPEHVGEEHADRALGEVEDARGGVGDHQTGGGDGVHRSVGDAHDQPEQDRVERDRAARPRLHAHEHRERCDHDARDQRASRLRRDGALALDGRRHVTPTGLHPRSRRAARHHGGRPTSSIMPSRVGHFP